MSKKLILALATITMLASAAAISTSAFAQRAPGHPGGHPGGYHPGGHPGGYHPGGYHPKYHPHWKHWRVHYRYRAPVAYAVTTPAVAGPCTCLTKQYTPEGAVLFKDICTNEAAMNPPLPAEVPQQTSLYQAQPQQMLPQQPIPQAQ